VTIRTSSAKAIDALLSDLRSESAVTRDAAVARLTVIGPRAVERLTDLVDRPEAGATARGAALRALEALGDARALDAALRATADVDAGVAEAAVAVIRPFLRGRRGTAALDHLMTLVLNRACRETVRLEALVALGDVEPSMLEPLWQAVADDPSRAIRAQAAAGRRGEPEPYASAAEQMAAAAERELPDDPGTLRRLLGTDGTAAPLPVLHRIVERVREREASEPPARRGEWTRVRGTAHVALAKRSSRLGLYDLREALEGATAPLPVEFLAALSLVGDAACLEAIAAAHTRATDRWWRDHLADAFRAIATRERLTRRHAVMKKIHKRWPELVSKT
jgi:HEAT repeat protein